MLWRMLVSDVNEVVAGKDLTELNALIAAAEQEKERAKEAELASFNDLVEQVKVKAIALGLNVKSFFVEKQDRSAKYANPANPAETYTGFGPRPDWLKALLTDIPKENVKEELKKYLIA